jgi:farnesyl diphosphate synthase
LRFACAAGAILGEAGRAELATLERFGSIIGQAFQIADDLLDVEGDSATLGKAAHKDAGAGKATLVGILGVSAAKARLEGLVKEAETTLAPFGTRAQTLIEAAKFIAHRQT